MRRLLTACALCALLATGLAFVSTAGAARSAASSLIFDRHAAPAAGAARLQDAPAQAPATVFVDKPDYLPGEVVTITGSNWAQNEVVTLTLHKERGDEKFDDIVLTAVS